MIIEFTSGAQKSWDSFDVIPAGDYVGVIRKIDRRDVGGLDPSDPSYRGFFLNLGHEITEGEYAGRWVFSKLHVGNPSAKAREAAAMQLETLTQALGITSEGQLDTEALMDTPVILKVRQEGASSEYGASNTVNGYASVTPAEAWDGADLT